MGAGRARLGGGEGAIRQATHRATQWIEFFLAVTGGEGGAAVRWGRTGRCKIPLQLHKSD